APVMAARQILGVDVLSNGRLDIAVGSGWHPVEYEAAGTSMKTRGARMDEMMDLINRLFQPGDIEFEGKYYRVPKTKFEPKPVQKPRPPFLVGGGAEAALRRAARWDGWYGVAMDVEGFLAAKARIDGYRREIGRENEPFEYVLVFFQGGPGGHAPSRDILQQFADAGAHRFVVTPWAFDYENALPAIANYARDIGLGA
ncbi:MAG: LLM class flavin-dependent oxidoreductase, partial [Caulobacterales bacterium]